jgi:hypothetical protein
LLSWDMVVFRSPKTLAHRVSAPRLCSPLLLACCWSCLFGLAPREGISRSRATSRPSLEGFNGPSNIQTNPVYGFRPFMQTAHRECNAQIPREGISHQLRHLRRGKFVFPHELFAGCMWTMFPGQTSQTKGLILKRGKAEVSA